MIVRARRARPPAPQALPLRRAAGVIVAAIILSGGAPAVAEPGWIMVPGVGAGRVTLGMTGPDVIAALGAPAAYCTLGTYRGEQQSVTVLYYANRGLALTLSAARGTLPTVSRVHVVAGYSAILSDETTASVNGRTFRKCVPNGTVTLNVPDGVYVTNSGIRPGSAEADVVAKFGPPKVQYPAVGAGGRLLAAADIESLQLHRMLLLPYPARILAYDGIAFGIYHGTVVAITIDWTGFDPHRYIIADERAETPGRHL